MDRERKLIFFFEESRMRMRWEIADYARIVRRDDEKRTGGRDGDKAKERIGGRVWRHRCREGMVQGDWGLRCKKVQLPCSDNGLLALQATPFSYTYSRIAEEAFFLSKVFASCGNICIFFQHLPFSRSPPDSVLYRFRILIFLQT